MSLTYINVNSAEKTQKKRVIEDVGTGCILGIPEPSATFTFYDWPESTFNQMLSVLVRDISKRTRIYRDKKTSVEDVTIDNEVAGMFNSFAITDYIYDRIDENFAKILAAENADSDKKSASNSVVKKEDIERAVENWCRPLIFTRTERESCQKD